MNSMQAHEDKTTLGATYAGLIEVLEIMTDRNEETAVFDVNISLDCGSHQQSKCL